MVGGRKASPSTKASPKYVVFSLLALSQALPLFCASSECALEDETYEDGAETQVECNRCVCACGNWVCTAMTCEGPYAPQRVTVCGFGQKNSHSVSFQRHQLSRVLLSPAFPQLLHGWFLHNPHLFHVSQTQAGTVPEVRNYVTGLGGMLMGFVVWIWCHENSALNLPG